MLMSKIKERWRNIFRFNISHFAKNNYWLWLNYRGWRTRLPSPNLKTRSPKKNSKRFCQNWANWGQGVWILLKHYKIAELKDDMLFCLRTLEINRLLEEVKRDKAKLEGQCKDLNSDLKNKVTFWREIENENERLGKMKRSTLVFFKSRWGRWKTDWPQWRPGNSRNWLKLVSSCHLMSQTVKKYIK